MDRIQINWRDFARRTGYSDLILSGLFILIAGLAIFQALDITTVAVVAKSTDSEDKPLDPETNYIFTWGAVLFWALAGLMVLIAALHLMAAKRLLKSTELGRAPLDALKLARFWRTVSIISIVICAPIFIATSDWMLTTLCLIVRAGVVLGVLKFMRELEVESVTSGNGDGKVKDASGQAKV